MRSIVISGFARQGNHVARLLRAHAPGCDAVYYANDRVSVARSIAHAVRADAVISIGWPPHAFVHQICCARRRPAVFLWVGTDVLEFSRMPEILEPLRLQNLVHWACGAHLVPELAALGIDARYVKIAAAPACDVPAPFPREFTVLAYLPKPLRDFYGQADVWEAARALPDARFVIVGEGGGEACAPKNVHYAGEVSDMDRRIDEACVLLRMPQHDGLAVMAIEALARGRHVVWTHTLPGSVRASSVRDAIESLAKLRDEHRAGNLQPNYAGIQYARREHAPAEVARGFLAALEDAAAQVKKEPAPAARCVRIAISGQGVFAARVASNCRQFSQRLSAAVLTTSKGSETAVSMLEIARSDVWYTIGQSSAPHAFEITSSLMRKPRLMHWLGNDVHALAHDARLKQRYRSARFQHLAQNEYVADRLRELGISSRVAPLAAIPETQKVERLPETFTVLLYLPPDRPEFYGRFQYERLMAALTGERMHYIIVGGGEIAVPRGVSAERLGWIHDLGPTYDRCTVLARFTQNDSVSTMVLEALAHGRYVLWSNDAAFVRQIRDYSDLEKSLRDLLAAHAAGTLAPQFEAAAAVVNEYSPRACIAVLEQALGHGKNYRTTTHIESFTPGASRSERAKGR